MSLTKPRKIFINAIIDALTRMTTVTNLNKRKYEGSSSAIETSNLKFCKCECKCGAFPGVQLASIAISLSAAAYNSLNAKCVNSTNESEPKKRIQTVLETSAESETVDSPVHVYTDGACSSNGKINSQGGIGVYWGPNNPMNVSEPLFGRQTNNRAEIMAAVRALRQAKSAGYKNVVLHTDSQFLINGITKWIRKWKANGWKLSSGGSVINKEDFEALDDAQKGLIVRYKYVKGHSGDPGNEAADRLATQAADVNT
ncbi:Ribonuclease H1 [Chamberlinius hualienensis]